MTLSTARLEEQLGEHFAGSSGEYRTVAREAADLAASGRYEATHDHELSAEVICSELADCPSGSVADRWNWWIGALEIAHGGYAAFGIAQYRR